MVDLTTWTTRIVKSARERKLKEDQRAAEAFRRICIKPTVVVFRTPSGARLAGQTVRVESDNTATPGESTAGSAPVRKVIVYGVRKHPTEPDTIMKEGYVFVFEGDEYKCVDVIVTLGEIQGIWEATG